MKAGGVRKTADERGRASRLIALLACATIAGGAGSAAAQGSHSMQALVDGRRDSGAQQALRAEQLRRAGRHGEAIAIYRALLERRARDATLHRDLAASLLEVGDVDEAVFELHRVVELEPGNRAHLFALASGCERAGKPVCAMRAYTTILEREPNARAAARIDALGGGMFERPYPFDPGADRGTVLPPWARSGLTLSIGVGNQYAGVGGQVAYEWVPAPGKLALAPYGSAGVVPGSLSVLPSFALGAVGSYGGHRRLLLDLGFGAWGLQRFALFGHVAAERMVYAASAQIGCQWTFRSGVLLRALIGVALPTDRSVPAEPGFALSLGVGVKP